MVEIKEAIPPDKPSCQLLNEPQYGTFIPIKPYPKTIKIAGINANGNTYPNKIDVVLGVSNSIALHSFFGENLIT